MPEKVVFTIVAKNYIGLAKVLGDSICEREQDVRFHVFIVDEYDGNLELPNDAHDYLFVQNDVGIPGHLWEQMAFMYNITEFCTSVKPFCFEYLMDRYSEGTNLVYFDPDIYAFSPLTYIWEKLNNYQIIVTPHIITPELKYSGDLLETNLLCSGLFNLGFLAIKNSQISRPIIAWWRERLKYLCFVERTEGLFTDQKWMDFLPSLLSSEHLFIARHLGMNMAPWNFFERQVVRRSTSWWVKNRITGDKQEEQLIFVHFSGFNYHDLDLKRLANKNIPSLQNFQDVYPLFESYKHVIERSDIKNYFSHTYSYDHYTSGVRIMSMHRRIFRRLVLDNNAQGSPFNHRGEFYKILILQGMISKSETNPDKLNERNFSGFENKLKWLNRAHIVLFKILGVDRYFILTKFLKRYYKSENQIFLFDRKYIKKSFKNEVFDA